MARGVGGEGGARGGRDPNAGRSGPIGGGTGNGGFSGGMFGATARRTPVQSPSYEASLGNLAKMAGTMMPGAGLVQGAMGLATGQFGPSYSGYTGHVNTPGSYDPKGGPQMQGGGGELPLAVQRMLLTGGYGGANRALYTPGMGGAPQMFMPQPAAQANPAAAPSAALPQQSFAPGMFMNTGGKYGSSAYRPGYSFLTPGSI